MIYKLFDNIISVTDLNNWNYYKDNLNNYNLINVFFRDKLQSWIQSLRNPLEVPIILDLFNNNLNEVENKLASLINKIGSENFRYCIEEINNTFESYNVTEKIYSIYYELEVFFELSTEDIISINKIDKYGDWETPSKIFSVKSKMPLDFNYKIIELFLNSLCYIKEYNIIRNYKNIRLDKGNNINYNFINELFDFLWNNIHDILEEYDKIKLYDLEDITKSFNYRNLKINTNAFFISGKKSIEINISNYNISSIELTLQPWDYKYINITYETDGYFKNYNTFNKSVICKMIKNKIEDIEKSFRTYRDTNKNNKSFEGWIVIPIHQRDETFAIEEMKSIINCVKSDRNYNFPIFIYVIPQIGFDLKNKFIIEIK